MAEVEETRVAPQGGNGGGAVEDGGIEGREGESGVVGLWHP